MNILALEFSSPRRSVAVSVAERVTGRASEEGMRDTHAFALIDSALKQAGIHRSEIESIAIGLGPGSYAGIRIAVAIAQGWQLAAGVKLLGISSADAVAAQEHARGCRGLLNTLIDAQRKELFRASYELTDAGWTMARPFELVTNGEPAGRSVRFDVSADPAHDVVLPEAATIATLAQGRADYISGPELSPIYLRKAEFVKAPPPRFRDI